MTQTNLGCPEKNQQQSKLASQSRPTSLQTRGLCWCTSHHRLRCQGDPGRQAEHLGSIPTLCLWAVLPVLPPFFDPLKKKKHSTLGGCHGVMSSVFLSRNHRLGYTGCTQHTARHLATLVIVHQSSWNMAVEEPGRALFFHGTTLSCAEHTKLAMNYAESAEYCTCTPRPGVPLRGLSCHQLFGVWLGVV